MLIRNALFHRVQLMDLDKPEALGALDKEWGYGVHEWEDALDDFYDEHEYVNTDAKARSAELFMLDEKHENDEHSWHVRQIIDDSDGDHDWAITGTIDLDATQSSGRSRLLRLRRHQRLTPPAPGQRGLARSDWGWSVRVSNLCSMLCCRV